MSEVVVVVMLLLFLLVMPVQLILCCEPSGFSVEAAELELLRGGGGGELHEGMQ